MKKVLTFLAFLILLFSMASCMYLETGIDPEIKPFIDDFYKEAHARGIYPGKVITAQFSDIKRAQGRSVKATKAIYLDQDSEGWRSNPEALVFHELAHLLLDRDHDNTRINKFSKSIMASERDPVYHRNEGEKLYYRRQYYIDELFNQNTPAAEWMR
jgi:hypothetical protein